MIFPFQNVIAILSVFVARVCMCTSTEYRHLSGYHEHFLSVPFSNDGRMGHLLGFSSLYVEV